MITIALLFALVALALALRAKFKSKSQTPSVPIAEKEKEQHDTLLPRPITPLTVDWTTLEKSRFRPFKPIYHMTMGAEKLKLSLTTGLKNTRGEDLISIDSDYLSHINQRRALVRSLGSGVHGVVHGTIGAAAVREMYDYLLGSYLPERFPTIFSIKDGQTTNSITGRTVPSKVTDMSDAGAEATLRILAETVEEDLFFVTQEPDGHHRCVAFVCCFPSGFDPASKLGKGLDAIHEPVPSYERIGPSMERFFSKLEVGKPVTRINWSVQTHGDLHNLASNHITSDEEIRAEDVDPSKCHFRCENQHLSRLPNTRVLVFSFKTYLYPLAEVKAEGLGPQLADAIDGLQKGNAPGMYRYKAAIRWGPKSCEFLRS